MRGKLLDKQAFHSHRVTLYSNGNVVTILVLAGQGSLQFKTQLAGFNAPAENFEERRGCAIIDHLKDDTGGCLPSAR